MTRRSDGRFQEVITINGKKKYFYGRTKAEVLRKIQEYKEKEEIGKAFIEVAEEWQEEHWSKLAPSSSKSYKKSLERAINNFNDTPIKEITPAQINRLLQELVLQQFGKKVVSRQLSVLNMIFNYAIYKEYLLFNPCSVVNVPKGLSAKKRELPSDHDIDIVKKTEWLFPFFLLYSGLRKGEALALTYADIDREKNVIHINKAVGYDGNKPFLKSTKTEAGNRSVILLDALKERIPNKKRGLIFPNKNGELYTQSGIEKKWNAWRRENNVEVSPHQLRHAYATILFDAGIEAKDAQYLLGHSTIAVTQDIYTHIRQERQKENALKLNSYINNNLK